MLLAVCTSVVSSMYQCYGYGVGLFDYPQTNLQIDLSIFFSLKNELREFDKRSKYFLVGDHVTYSHHLSP